MRNTMQVSLLARTRGLVIAMFAKYERRRRSVVVASSLDHNRPSPRLDTFFVLVTKLRSIALRFSLAWCFARCGISDAYGFKLLYGWDM